LIFVKGENKNSLPQRQGVREIALNLWCGRGFTAFDSLSYPGKDALLADGPS
jgi:hypothetical protein